METFLTIVACLTGLLVVWLMIDALQRVAVALVDLFGRVIAAMSAIIIAIPMLFDPADIPKRYSPFTPLNLDEAPSFVGRWKFRAVVADRDLCRATLDQSRAGVTYLPDHRHSAKCHIRNQTRLVRLSSASVAPLKTTCQIAARLYLWELHSLQPAARRILGTTVTAIRHFDSYSCRGIRSSTGMSSRMSEHATANAVDISGFRLADGREISLVRDWQGTGEKATFLRAARRGLCNWFNLVLSPDYNTLHADHFHADMGRWPGCR